MNILLISKVKKTLKEVPQGGEEERKTMFWGKKWYAFVCFGGEVANFGSFQEEEMWEEAAVDSIAATILGSASGEQSSIDEL